MKKDLSTLRDLTKEDIGVIIKRGEEIKRDFVKNSKPLEN